MIDPKTGPKTGAVHAAPLFVATSRLRRASGTTGASNSTYAEATWTQSLPDWIASRLDRQPRARLCFLRGRPGAGGRRRWSRAT